jgi:hypothetical protein
MNTHADKASKNKGQVIANGLAKLRQGESKSPFQFADNRPEAVAQRRLQELADKSQQVSRLRSLQQLANASPHVSQLKSLQRLANNSPQVKQAAQLQAQSSAKAPSPIQQEIASGIAQLAQVPEEKELIQAKPQTAQRQPNESDIKPRQNNTGLPDKLKTGIESLSGMSLDHVKVHYNSSQPAQLNALAYAQGSDIHVAPGQEQHLPHEAWHIVQQAQGRVQPTMQMKDGVAINDDAGLEREADVMGGRALAFSSTLTTLEIGDALGMSTIENVRQLRKKKMVKESARKHYNDGWGAAYKITDDDTLKNNVADDVKGEGDISLGNFIIGRYKDEKTNRKMMRLTQASIAYKDFVQGWGKYKSFYTSIYHCGPSGGTWVKPE